MHINYIKQTYQFRWYTIELMIFFLTMIFDAEDSEGPNQIGRIYLNT